MDDRRKQAVPAVAEPCTASSSRPAAPRGRDRRAAHVSVSRPAARARGTAGAPAPAPVFRPPAPPGMALSSRLPSRPRSGAAREPSSRSDRVAGSAPRNRRWWTNRRE